MSALNDGQPRVGRRTFFVLTDNGDWMEMTPNGPLEGPGVEFYAVDLEVADFDALDEVVGAGSGQLLARAYVQDEALCIRRSHAQLEADATHASPGLSRVMPVALERAEAAANATAAGDVPIVVVAGRGDGVDTFDVGLAPDEDAVSCALAHARDVALDQRVTTIAWTYPTLGVVCDGDIPAPLLIAEGLDADGTHVAAACLTLGTHSGTQRGPWYRIRATETPTAPWDLEQLHRHLTL